MSSLAVYNKKETGKVDVWMKPLQEKIAVVAGATRGVGRAIAVSLGEAGATVYCTGRSTREKLSDMILL